MGMEAILLVLLFGALIGRIQPIVNPTSKNVVEPWSLSTSATANSELTTTINQFSKERLSGTQKEWFYEQGASYCVSLTKQVKNYPGANECCIALAGDTVSHCGESEWVSKCMGSSYYSILWQNGSRALKPCYDESNNTRGRTQSSVIKTLIVSINNQKHCSKVCTRKQVCISIKPHNLTSIQHDLFYHNHATKYVCVKKNEIINETQQNLEPPSEAGNTLQNKTALILDVLEKESRVLIPSAELVQHIGLQFLKASVGINVSEVDANRTASIIDQVLRFTTETLIAAQKSSNASTCFLTGLEHMLTNLNLSNISLIASGFRADAIDITGSPSLLYTSGGLKGSPNNTMIVRNPSAEPPNDEYDVTVTFNVSNLNKSRSEVSTVAFMYHPTLRLADAALAAKIQYADVYHINSSNGDSEEVLAANYTAFTGMVQVGLRGIAVSSLPEPVNLYFRPLEPVNLSSPSISIICVFWNPKVNDGKGGWSTYGCWYQGVVKQLVHCQCNHFSAFTALYAYDEEVTDTVHDTILNWITRIGCALSLLGLVAVIGAYVVVPKCRVQRPGFYGHHIIFQQSLSLTALMITFLSGFDKTENSVNCMFVAALLHYFMLVVFFWMLMEAYYYYCLFVKVRGINTSSFMLKACMFAWLLPCLIVITLLSIEMDVYSYTDGKYCWLTTFGFYYTLLPVVAIITVINLVVYVVIIVKVGCGTSKLSSTQQPHRLSPHTAVAIFFLLGLSWTFGLLAIGEVRTFFSYLFCIFNSLQGCVIFLLFFHRGRVAQQRKCDE